MRVAVTLATLFIAAASLSADTWPHWRGPAASGIATGPIPATWSATQNVA